MFGAAAFASLTAAARGEAPTPAPAGAAETIALWPDKPPGGPGPKGVEQVTPFGSVANVVTPRMIVRRPAKPNGAAVLILGGGGYRRISIAREAQPTAAWLLDYGVTTFTLYYRLPNGGWPLAAPFQDAQRAMRLIRSRAATLGLDESQIGIIGYSAGGHCAGMTSVRPDAALYQKVDAVDDVSARPDFAGLIYPVLTMLPPNRTKISTLTLLGSNPTPSQSAAMSVEQLVTDDAPTTFLAHATDDPIAPVENSLLMFAALRRVHVPVEMHVFRSGGHGFNLGQPGNEDQAWPKLFATWAGFEKS
jgi:acetyl esterase/lipase